MKRTNLIVIISAVSMMGTTHCGNIGSENEDHRNFNRQNNVIQASIALEFEMIKERGRTYNIPYYLDVALMTHRSFHSHLSSDIDAHLEQVNAWDQIYDMVNDEYLDIFKRKDWKTIQALVRDCNTLLDENGRLACEFDGGYDFTATPFTTLLFNVAYFKRQSQRLIYWDGRYNLIGEDEPTVALDMYDLLRRNAIVRVISNRLLSKTTSLLMVEQGQPHTSIIAPLEVTEPFPIFLTHREIYKHHCWKETMWRGFLEENLEVSLDWSGTGYELTDQKTNKKISYLRDEGLIYEALEGLNYYREKVDFSRHFMFINYPMYLLSILRLYDVNLQIDETTNEIIIVPGPTDPETFFDIVAECTFVDDPSDTEYLKKHLTGWLEPGTEATRP